MIRVVLDASVALKWFRRTRERHIRQADRLRADYREGRVLVLVPPLFELEILNVAVRKWAWPSSELTELAATLEELELERGEPDLASVAHWAGRGLTAYDASYVALADSRGIPLVTDDDTVCAAAPGVAQPLARWRPPATS